MQLNLKITEKDVFELIKYNPYYAHYKSFSPERYLQELKELENLNIDIEIDKEKGRIIKVNKELSGFQKQLLAVKISKEVMNNEKFVLQDKVSSLKVPKLKEVPALTKILPVLPSEAGDFYKQLDVLDDFNKVYLMREVYINQAEKQGIDAKYLKELLREGEEKGILKVQKAKGEVVEAVQKGGGLVSKLKNKWYYLPISAGLLSLMYYLLTDKEDEELKKLSLPPSELPSTPIPPNLYKTYADMYARMAGLLEREYLSTVREAQKKIFLAQLYHQYAMNKYLQAYNTDAYTLNKIILFSEMQYNLKPTEKQKLMEKLLKGAIVAKARGVEVENVAEYLKYSDVEMPDLENSLKTYIKTVDEFLSYNLKPLEKKINLYNELSASFMKKAVDYTVKYQLPHLLENQAISLRENLQKRINELSNEIQELQRKREELEKSSIPAQSDDKTLFSIIKRFFKLGKKEKEEEEKKEEKTE